MPKAKNIQKNLNSPCWKCGIREKCDSSCDKYIWFQCHKMKKEEEERLNNEKA